MRAARIIAVLATAASGCGNGEPPPSQADAAIIECAPRTGACPSCSNAFAGDAGSTVADLCTGTCSAWQWNALITCTSSGPCSKACGDAPIDPAHRTAACGNCIETLCAQQLAACLADK